MAMWRCPHCGTPQAETSRCWVCKRSSTSCGTCRHFRRAVAGQLGYCGLDRTRQALRGDELRGCWEAGPSFEEQVRPQVRDFAPPRRRLEFVPVESAKPRTTKKAPAAPPSPALPRDPLLGFWTDEA